MNQQASTEAMAKDWRCQACRHHNAPNAPCTIKGCTWGQETKKP